MKLLISIALCIFAPFTYGYGEFDGVKDNARTINHGNLDNLNSIRALKARSERN